ncbi:hypothetical protein KCM76_20765 [Zooshikella marina]|uniref:hypothetical protein n=1 Tax=Zooshikella ganghwensis TaxID=202772 RepID=UPI001BAF4D26|nr:hypothetical protein [Zooshikella ganghwensis]MBU2708438.1 hypothetical protein [Zooshikella ganghwensis]
MGNKNNNFVKHGLEHKHTQTHHQTKPYETSVFRNPKMGLVRRHTLARRAKRRHFGARIMGILD